MIKHNDYSYRNLSVCNKLDHHSETNKTQISSDLITTVKTNLLGKHHFRRTKLSTLASKVQPLCNELSVGSTKKRLSVLFGTLSCLGLSEGLGGNYVNFGAEVENDLY